MRPWWWFFFFSHKQGSVWYPTQCFSQEHAAAGLGATSVIVAKWNPEPCNRNDSACLNRNMQSCIHLSSHQAEHRLGDCIVAAGMRQLVHHAFMQCTVRKWRSRWDTEPSNTPRSANIHGSPCILHVAKALNIPEMLKSSFSGISDLLYPLLSWPSEQWKKNPGCILSYLVCSKRSWAVVDIADHLSLFVVSSCCPEGQADKRVHAYALATILEPIDV